MEDAKKHLESLSEIKELMERSTKFISLSGLSGVVAGVMALAGASLAYMRLQLYYGNTSMDVLRNSSGRIAGMNNLAKELFLIAVAVLVVSLLAGILLTLREAKKKGQNIWGKNSMLLLGNLLIPLITGGIFCLIMIYHGWFILLAPLTLIFYGLALISASKYTFVDVKYLGIGEIILGLVSAIYLGQGLLFWAMGFGVLHIVYGTLMHFKYNRN